MLNVNEIKNLENKWKRYKIKKYFKIFIYIFIILVLFAIFILYYYNFLANKPKEARITKSIKKKSILKKHVANNTISIKVDKNVKNISVPEKNKTATIKISKSIINKNKTKVLKTKNTQNNDILQLNTEFLSNIYEEKNSTKKRDLKTIQGLKYNENNFTQDKLFSPQTSVENSKKEAQPFVEQHKKVKIIISSKKIDKLKYLKEQYNETKKAYYAVLISQEYYKKKLFSKSLIWATIANNTNSSNEESWIMFAKNKVKLGKRNDAINALSAYLRVNNSQKIQILLRNIKNGVFK